MRFFILTLLLGYAYSCNPLLVTVFMVKNEEPVMVETLNSYVNSGIKDYFFYDTGSTDNTVELLNNYTLENNLNAYIEEGHFIDFSTSRNQALKFAEERFPESCFIMMVDAEWLLHNGTDLLNHLDGQRDKNVEVYMIRMIGDNEFYQARVFRTSRKLRFKGAVHEVVTSTNRSVVPSAYFDLMKTAYGSQKSKQRWYRDLQILKDEVVKDPKDLRSLFYLGQTYSCLGNKEKAIEWYTKRAIEGGWLEERHVSMYRIGNLYSQLEKWDMAVFWYLKSYEIRTKRIEPLIKLADYYWRRKAYRLSYSFILTACNTPFPEDDILFINREDYEYNRYNLMGMIAWYVGEFEIGLKAVDIAISRKPGLPHLERNKELYEVKLNN